MENGEEWLDGWVHVVMSAAVLRTFLTTERPENTENPTEEEFTVESQLAQRKRTRYESWPYAEQRNFRSTSRF